MKKSARFFNIFLCICFFSFLNPIYSTQYITNFTKSESPSDDDPNLLKTKILEIIDNIEANPEPNENTIEKVFILLANLRSSNSNFASNDCENKMLKVGACHPTLAKDGSRMLKMAFLEGLYDMVQKSSKICGIDNKPSYMDYESFHIRARSAAEEFRKLSIQIVQRSPTEDEAERLRQLANHCTKAYEEALDKSPSDFERMRLAREWWGFNSIHHFKYKSDSLPFRQVMSLINEPNKINRIQLEERTKLVRLTFRNSLEESLKTEKITPEMREKLADTFSALFKQIAVIEIPEDTFSDILRDIPTFCNYCLPFRAKTNESITNTLQWYLWSAVFTPLPDEIERKKIDVQIKTYADMIESEMDNLLANRDFLKPAARECSIKFKETYEKYKDNRFVPYYKIAVSPAQFKKELELLIKEWDSRKGVTRDLSSGKTNQYYEWWQESHIEALLVELYTHMTSCDYPLYRIHLPKQIITGCGATLLIKDNIYVFVVRKTVPIPAFPW